MGKSKRKRQLVTSGSPFEERIGFSRAVRVGDRVLVSGTAPVWPDGSVNLEPKMQIRRCIQIIENALEEAGASLADVVRTRIYLVDPKHIDDISSVHGEVFGEIRPASTVVVVSALLDPRWKVEMEAEAVTSKP